MSYNHDAENLNDALGQSVQDVIKKAEKLALEMTPEQIGYNF